MVAARSGDEAGASAPRLVLLSPQGRPLDQGLLEELAREPWLVLLCGHYEGFDERVREGLEPLEISIGDFVLSGGEVPAMVLVDGIARLLPGVVGHPESVRQESFSRPEGGLDFPQYTRPRVYRGMAVPEVLVSGDHGKVAKWREAEAQRRTRARRPDLMEVGTASDGRADAAERGADITERDVPASEEQHNG
jgi:tRNA (guanine37-N1)-methyltransferase